MSWALVSIAKEGERGSSHTRLPRLSCAGGRPQRRAQMLRGCRLPTIRYSRAPATAPGNVLDRHIPGWPRRQRDTGRRRNSCPGAACHSRTADGAAKSTSCACRILCPRACRRENKFLWIRSPHRARSYRSGGYVAGGAETRPLSGIRRRLPRSPDRANRHQAVPALQGTELSLQG